MSLWSMTVRYYVLGQELSLNNVAVGRARSTKMNLRRNTWIRMRQIRKTRAERKIPQGSQVERIVVWRRRSGNLLNLSTRALVTQGLLRLKWQSTDTWNPRSGCVKGDSGGRPSPSWPCRQHFRPAIPFAHKKIHSVHKLVRKPDAARH